MDLSQLNNGDCATIIKIEGDKELKKRLFSFGVVPKANIKVESTSIAKSTIEINIDCTLIAIRKDEAKKIIIKKIDCEDLK